MNITLNKLGILTVLNRIDFTKSRDALEDGIFLPCVNNRLIEYMPFNYSQGESYLGRVYPKYPDNSSDGEITYNSNIVRFNNFPTIKLLIDQYTGHYMDRDSPASNWMALNYMIFKDIISMPENELTQAREQPYIDYDTHLINFKLMFDNQLAYGHVNLPPKRPFEITNMHIDGDVITSSYQYIDQPENKTLPEIIYSVSEIEEMTYKNDGIFEGKIKLSADILATKSVQLQPPEYSTSTIQITLTYRGTAYYNYPKRKTQLSFIDQHYADITTINYGEYNIIYSYQQNKANVCCIRNNTVDIISVQSLYSYSELTLRNFLIREQYNFNGDKISEQHYLYNNDFNLPNFNNQSEIDIFLNKVKDTFDIEPFSYGAKIENNLLTIPVKNVESIVYSNKIDVYNIPLLAQYNSELFSVTNGAYCALIDPINKRCYLLLVNGGGYYDLDLSFYDKTIDFFGFREENKEIIIGTFKPINFDEGTDDYNPDSLNYYSVFKLGVAVTNKAKNISFNRDKMQFSFIPCQTHCMGKGGIITKV